MPLDEEKKPEAPSIDAEYLKHTTKTSYQAAQAAWWVKQQAAIDKDKVKAYNPARYDFYEANAEKLAAGGRIVPHMTGVPYNFKDFGPPKTQHRLTSDELFFEGRPGATVRSAEGRTFEEISKETELAKHPGAVDISEMGKPVYGGKNEYEERRLEAEAALKYGNTVIDSSLDWDEELEAEFQGAETIAEKMDLVTKAYKGKQVELAEHQASLFSNKIYKGIYNTIGKTYHDAYSGGAILIRHFVGRAHEGWAGETSDALYKEALEKGAPERFKAVNDALFTTSPKTQLTGAVILADIAETLMWRIMPWSVGQESKLSLVPDLTRAHQYIQNHPGMSTQNVIANTVNPYWNDMAEEWLNPAEWTIDGVIDLTTFGIGKAFKALRAGTKITSRVARALGKLDEAGRLGGLTDEAYDVLKRDNLVKALMDDTAETITKKGEWANKNGLFTHTNETKAALTAEEVHEGVRWLALALDGKADVPEFMHMLQRVGDLASDNADEVDDALRYLSKHGHWDYWLTESGQTGSWMIREMVTQDPKYYTKMLKEIGEGATDAEKIARMLVYSDNFANDTAKKFFPVLELQKDLPVHLRAAAKVHKQAQRVYGPMMHLFSEMYLGKTPGYAVRNTVQNFGQTIYDLGIGSAGGAKYIDEAFEWAGIDKAMAAGRAAAGSESNVFFVGMERALGAMDVESRVRTAAAKAKQQGGIKRFLDFKWWSNEAEKLGGRTIFGNQYSKNMKKSLKGTVSRQFTDIGIDAKKARHWEDLIIKHKGNVREAMAEVAEEAAQGFHRNLSRAGFDDILRGEIDSVKGYGAKIDNIIDTAASKEDAIKQLNDYTTDILKAAEDQVIREGKTPPGIQHGDEALGNSATQAMEDGTTKMHDELSDYWMANQAVNDAVSDGLETFYKETWDAMSVVAGTANKGKGDLEKMLAETVMTPAGVFETLGQINGFEYLKSRAFGGRTPRVRKIEQSILRKQNGRLKDLKDGMKGDELVKFWVDSGLQDEFGNLGRLNWRDVKYKIVESWRLEQKGFWQQWRDQNYNFARRLVDDTVAKAQAVGATNIPNPKEMMSLASTKYNWAVKHDPHLPWVTVNFNLQKARKITDAGKANRVFATEYAKLYGIPLRATKDGRQIYLDKKLTAIINKQLGRNFPDLNSIIGPTEEVIQEALQMYSIGELRSLVKNPDDAIKVIGRVLADPTKVSPGDMKKLDDLYAVLGEVGDEGIQLRNKLNGTLSARGMLPGPPGIWTPEFGVEAKTVKQYNEMAKRVGDAQKALDDAGKEVAGFLRLRGEEVEEIAEKTFRKQTAIKKLPPEWGGESAPTVARSVHDRRDGIRAMSNRIGGIFDAKWDDVTHIDIKDARKWQADVEQATKVGEGMVREARMGSAKAAKETRDFILHNYGNRRNFDTLLAYIYPFHFWHSRTYKNWAIRLARKPYVARAYVKYKENMKKINKDMPEWYRYNIKYEGGMFGFDEDNPLIMNLEALINPLYGALGIPFDDHDKRKTGFSRMLDNLSSRGPSIHTPFALMYGFAQYMQGEQEAGAKWMGRFVPQTKPLSAMTSKLNRGRGIELDPSLIVQSWMRGEKPQDSFSALGPYEANRINMGLSQMVLTGKISQEQAVDAAMERGNNPVWVEAHALATSKRTLGDIAGFIGGPGMKVRTKDELEIMHMEMEFYSLMDLKDNMKPEDVAQAFAIMREKYPTYFNVTRLSRGNQEEREESLVYNVMSRVPPGQSGDFYEAVGMDYADLRAFYETKGESLKSMADTDRMKFMAGIYEMSAILEFPEDATRNEWNETSARWKDGQDRLLEYYGPETVAKKDEYWRLMKIEPQDAYDFVEANPDLQNYMSDEASAKLFDPLLRKYYASYGGTRQMVNAEMYQRLDDEFPGIQEESSAYYEARLTEKVKPSERLKDYWDRKRDLEYQYSSMLVSFGHWLPDGVEVPKRPDPPEEPTRAQQALIDLKPGQSVPAYYDWLWGDWAKLMSPSLQRLVQDWAFRGAELSDTARSSLEYALEPFSINTNVAMHLMRDASRMAGAQYYSGDNPPPGQ